jgi:glycosyltransferase involved in cell wall biosynthesis
LKIREQALHCKIDNFFRTQALEAPREFTVTNVRTIESTGFYYPDSSGGTEVYVRTLVQELKRQGIDCTIAAPISAEEPYQYSYEGVEVFRYPVPNIWDPGEIQGKRQPRKFSIFESWLHDQRGSVYHQHSWTTGCGLWHLEAAKRLGLRTVLTVHVPGNVCMRGTMLLNGQVPCDGKIVPERCATCWLQARGVPITAARGMAKVSKYLTPLLKLPRIGPAVAANALSEKRRTELQQMAAAANRIVAVCGWLYEALLANDVPPEKLVLSRQGIEHTTKAQPPGGKNKESTALRFGFLGRWDPVKGVDILVEAFKRVPESVKVELHICAPVAGAGSEKYRHTVQQAAACDKRIRFLPAKAHEEVGGFFARIDVLVVPSQWFETGPLVVLEAFAAGTPVIGSDLGGIKELIKQGSNGVLVPHDDVEAWATAMVQLATNPGFLERIRQGIGPVRTMSEVGQEMATLYRQLCAVDAHAT